MLWTTAIGYIMLVQRLRSEHSGARPQPSRRWRSDPVILLIGALLIFERHRLSLSVVGVITNWSTAAFPDQFVRPSKDRAPTIFAPERCPTGYGACRHSKLHIAGNPRDGTSGLKVLGLARRNGWVYLLGN